MSASYKYALAFLIISTTFNVDLFFNIELSEISILLFLLSILQMLWKKKSELFKLNSIKFLSIIFIIGIFFQSYLSFMNSYTVESMKIVVLFFIFFIIGVSIAFRNFEEDDSLYRFLLKLISINFILILVILGIELVAPSIYRALLGLVKDAHIYPWKSVAFYTHPNEFAYASVAQSFVALVLIKKININRFYYLPFFAISGFFVYLSHSRNGWIGLIILGIIYFLFLYKWKEISSKIKIAATFGVLITMVFIGLRNERIKHSILNLFDIKNVSFIENFKNLELERYLIWSAAFKEIKESVMTGKGHRHFLNTYEHISLTNPDRISHEYTEILNNSKLITIINWNSIPYSSGYHIKVDHINGGIPDFETTTTDTTLILNSLNFGELYRLNISTEFGENKIIKESNYHYLLTPSSIPSDLFCFIKPSVNKIGDSICLTIESLYNKSFALKAYDSSFVMIYNRFEELNKGLTHFFFPISKGEVKSFMINERTLRISNIDSEFTCEKINIDIEKYSPWKSLANIKKEEKFHYRYKACHQISWVKLDKESIKLNNSETYNFQSSRDSINWSKSFYYSTPSAIAASQIRYITPEFIIDKEDKKELALSFQSEFDQPFKLKFLNYDFELYREDSLLLEKGMNRFIYPFEKLGEIPAALLINEVMFILPQSEGGKVVQQNFNSHNLLIDLFLSIGFIGFIWLMSLFMYISIKSRSLLVAVSVLFLFGSLSFDNMSWSPVFPVIWSLIFSFSIIPLFKKSIE